MKFTQDNLIKIYLDGAFTEEAQAEFDRLMRKDPLFAEKVTAAVSERVGPAPEALLAQAEARLDAKAAGIWAAHRPSPRKEFLRKVSILLALAVGSGLLYMGYENLGGRLLSPLEQAPQALSGKSAPSKTLRLAQVEKRPGTLPAAASGERVGTSTLQRAGSTGLPSVSMPQVGSAPMGRSADRPQSPAQGSAPAAQSPDPAAAPSSREGFPLRLEVEAESRQMVSVTVIDAVGMPVRSLYSGTWEAGAHFLDWDGLDDSGRPLGPGTYTVVLEAGGKVQSGTVTIHPVR